MNRVKEDSWAINPDNTESTQFSLEKAENGEITFWTNNKKLEQDVEAYIRNCIDAVSWRRRVEQVTRYKFK